MRTRIKRRVGDGEARGKAATVTPDDRRGRSLASALRRAKQGRKLLPLFHVTEDGTCGCGDPDCSHVGKHPWVRAGTAPSSDPTVIKGWFERRPDSNLGEMIPAAELVLDVDYRHGGEASFRELVNEHGELPETIKVRTSGYVVVPPSKTASPYVYLVRGGVLPLKPAELPDAWIERLKKINRPSPDELLKRAIEKSQTEGRNNSGEWLVRQLWDNRYLKSEIRDCVRRYQVTVRDAVPGEEPYSVKEAKASETFSICTGTRPSTWTRS